MTQTYRGPPKNEAARRSRGGETRPNASTIGRKYTYSDWDWEKQPDWRADPERVELYEMALQLSTGGRLHHAFLIDLLENGTPWHSRLPLEVLGHFENRHPSHLDEVQTENLREAFWRAVATELFGLLPITQTPYGILHVRDPRAGWRMGMLPPHLAAEWPIEGSA
jgi:hypothetical protein